MVFVLLTVLGAHTKTTTMCHFFRAIHEHNRTHEHIPILLEACELVTFSTKADWTVLSLIQRGREAFTELAWVVW